MCQSLYPYKVIFLTSVRIRHFLSPLYRGGNLMKEVKYITKILEMGTAGFKSRST